MKYEFPCTDCGGDAFIGVSGWKKHDKYIIKKKERLCLKCAAKRGVYIFNKKPKSFKDVDL